MGRADRVIRFVENLTITSGTFAGQPFRLRQWQVDIIRGIYDPVDEQSRRVVRTALITMPRKNGKTQLAAALVLAHLIGPEAELRGQVYSAAADRAQAGIIFNEAAAMLRADPDLLSLVNIIESTKRIVAFRTGSFYCALSSEARSKHGFNASCIIYDELAQAPNRTLFDVLTTSTAARLEPLTIVISTQSNDPNHIMSELVAYGRNVIEKTFSDDSFFAAIYAAPMDADPWQEDIWHQCNPALGDFRSIAEMRTSAEQAKRIPAREAAFRSLYLNQPVDAFARFIASADWLACGAPVEPAELEGRRCWAGLDLSSTQDLTACVLFFPDDGGAVLPFFWIPGENIEEREHLDRVPYRVWRDQGLIEATRGRAVDRRAIAFRLREISERFDLRGIAYDRWGMETLQPILEDEGIQLPLTGWGQGFKDMGPAVSTFEEAVLSGALRHGGHPVLTWNVANAVIEMDPAGARKIRKDKGRARVDGLVALVMALGLHARQPGEWEFGPDRPLFVFA